MNRVRKLIEQNKWVLVTLLVIFVSILFFKLLTQRKYGLTELSSYISDQKNGLSLIKTINGIKINLTNRPTSLIAYQNCAHSLNDYTSNYSKDSCYDAAYHDALKFYHFVLSLSEDGDDLLKGTSVQNKGWKQISYYLSFTLEKEAMLITDYNDTVLPSLVHFARFYGISASCDLFIAFPRPNKAPKRFFTVVIPEFGMSTGNVRNKR